MATSREDNLRKYAMFADRVPAAMFGLDPKGRWDLADILDLMVRRVGVSPDPAYRRGPDRIDAALTVAGLDRMAERLAAVASTPGARVIVATGHPAGLLPVHLAVVAALRNRGIRILTPVPGWSYQTGTGTGSWHREIRYVDDVATVSNRGELNHTHSPRPMEAMLRSLAEAGEPPPDLVVGDHGWVGAAGQAGVTVGRVRRLQRPRAVRGRGGGHRRRRRPPRRQRRAAPLRPRDRLSAAARPDSRQAGEAAAPVRLIE